jgi:hypothetical protein
MLEVIPEKTSDEGNCTNASCELNKQSTSFLLSLGRHLCWWTIGPPGCRKQHNLTVFGSKTTGRPREVHLGFDIIITLWIVVKNNINFSSFFLCVIHASGQPLTIGEMTPWGTNSPPAEMSTQWIRYTMVVITNMNIENFFFRLSSHDRLRVISHSWKPMSYAHCWRPFYDSKI